MRISDWSSDVGSSDLARTVRPHELALTVDAPPSLFECCVDLGREAVDTRSNADETAKWVKRRGYRSIRLVTSAWHMPRARLELSARLDDDVLIVSDAVPGDRPPAAMSREYPTYVLRLLAVWLGLVLMARLRPLVMSAVLFAVPVPLLLLSLPL